MRESAENVNGSFPHRQFLPGRLELHIASADFPVHQSFAIP